MTIRGAFNLLLVIVVPSLLLFAQGAGKKAVTVSAFVTHERNVPIMPIWSPDGKRFMYEQEDSVYLYTVADRKPHEWFRPETLEKAATPVVRPKEFGWQNRRVAAHTYQWFPNGRDLLVSAGADLFILRENGQSEQITKTGIAEEDPKLSPDGTRVLYRWQANLYVLNLSTKNVSQLTSNGTPTLLNGQLDWVYPEELDLGTATWWSPDAKQIAYLQFDVAHEFIYPQTDLLGERALSEPERYPQAGTSNALVRLGTVSASGGDTRWMQLGDTGNTLLARIAWLPNSSQVAVERFTRLQDRLDLLFCDPLNGTVRTVLHEGSKTWINVADNLFFLKSRPEFIWTSERSGFRHIYRYADNGELLGQLTQGEWEVSAISAIDESDGRVYYASSEASPLETQLYSVGFDGGSRSRLTKAEGSHEIHASPDGSYFLDTYSNLKQPAQTVLSSAQGEQISVLQPMDQREAREYDILPSQIVTVKTPDGITLFGRLIKPAGFRTGVKYPAVVQVYGGPGVQTVRNRWYGVDLDQVFAHRGYVVWQLDNRGSKGRGMAFEAPLYREMGKQEVADQRLGVEQLMQSGFIDKDRIGVTGWSYGGYMTIHCLLFAPDVFKVGVAGAPVTDWHNYDTIYTERYMGLPDQNARGYDASSNVKNAARLQGKLLILHNFEDDNVLFQNTMQMANALEAAGKPFFMQVYPQKTHGVTGRLRTSLYNEMLDFFDARLKAQ